MRPDLSLVVPVFNEEARLPATLDRLAAFAAEARLRLDVIVADDGSRDGTAAAFARWASSSSPASMTARFITIRHRGKGAAVRAGMRHVTAPIVGYTDADLSAGPDAIVQLLEAMARGADFAMASRGLRESVLAVRQPWYRELAGRTFNLGMRTITGVPFKDTQCGLKLFTAETAGAIFGRQRLDGFAFDIELVLLAMDLGLRIDEIPVRWAHAEGSKVSMVRDSFRMARDTLRVSRRRRRDAAEGSNAGVPGAGAMAMMTQGEDTHWWHVAKRRMVAPYVDAMRSPQRCLDIGCGGGALLAALQGECRGGVVGIDQSVLALASARGRRLTELACAEAAALPFPAGAFSTVMALDTLEHHAEPERLLAEAARVLVPGGRVIVTVPAFQWMWSYADDVMGHYRRYTRREIVDELSDAGFVIIRASYFHSWLLPVAWVVRRIKGLLGLRRRPDDARVPGPLNTLLLKLTRLELRLLQRRDLPFGLSILVVAEKKGA